jgi:hypothetical protein
VAAERDGDRSAGGADVRREIHADRRVMDERDADGHGWFGHGATVGDGGGAVNGGRSRVAVVAFRMSGKNRR